MISDGIRLLPSAIHLTLVPGLDARRSPCSAINVFGDGVRDALDPRAKVRHRSTDGAASSSAGCSRWSLVLFAISILTFLIFQAIPNGDPALRLAGRLVDARDGRGDPRGTWGFDKPIYDQYLQTMKQDLHGQGRSPTRSRSTCSTRSGSGLPARCRWRSAPGIIWLALGIAVRACSARSRRAASPTASLTVLALIGVSTPVFLLGALMLYFLGYKAADLPERRLRRAHAATRGEWLTT